MGPKLRSCIRFFIFFFGGFMGKIWKTFNLEAVLVSIVCGCRWCWQSRHQTHWWKGGKGKDLDGSCGWAVRPARLQRLCKKALEILSYFPQPQNNCLVCIKDGPLLYLVSAGCPLLLFSISFLPPCICKSSWWAKELSLIKMLPSFCLYFMDVDGYLRINNLLVFRFWLLGSLCLHMMANKEFLEKSLLSQPVTAWSLKLNACQGYHRIGYCRLLFPWLWLSAILPLQSSATKTIFIT